MNEKMEIQQLCIAETVYETTFTRKFKNHKPYVAPDPNMIRCVIPGVIQQIFVRPGQKIRKGDPVCVLEAMKMQNDIVSPFDAKVKSIHVNVGQMVTKGQLLVALAPPLTE